MPKSKTKKTARVVHIPAVPKAQRLQEAARARSPVARLEIPLVSKKTTMTAKKRTKRPS